MTKNFQQCGGKERENGTASSLNGVGFGRVLTSGLAVLSLVLLASSVSADILTHRSKHQDIGTVIEVTATNVLLSTGQSVSVRDLSLITFARSSVVAQDQGLLLVDGSRLSGTLHRQSKTNVTFRTTSLGPVSLPLDQVAAIYFSREFDPESLQVPPRGGILVMLKTGKAKRGQLFASSTSTWILRTEAGLDKIAVQDMAYVAFHAAAQRPGIILRNGDRLNMAPSWLKTGVVVTLAKRKTALGLRALQAIDFTGKIIGLNTDRLK